MARRTTRPILDVVGLDQLRSDLFLVFRHVREVEDLVLRPDVLLRRAMAGEAPLHRQRRLLVRQRHLVDAAMARGAANALGDVNAVIEADEVGQPVDTAPDERLAGGEAGANRLEHRRIRPDLRVAVHARLRRRNSGKARRLDGGMAVAAVDAESGDVMLMAERDWLLTLDALIREKRRADDSADHPQDETDDEYRAEDGDARNRVGTSVENLRHLGWYHPSVISTNEGTQ